MIPSEWVNEMIRKRVNETAMENKTWNMPKRTRPELSHFWRCAYCKSRMPNKRYSCKNCGANR